MDKTYQPLDSTHLKTGVLHPLDVPAVIHLEDPAYFVMNDFKLVAPRVIGAKKFLGDAEDLMEGSRSHLLLVEGEHDKIIGIVRSQDIYGNKPQLLVSEHGVEHEKISVEMIMTPLESILSLSTETLRHAKVGHILQTFAKHNCAYALVYEDSAHAPSLCGSFSKSQIDKKMAS